MDPQKKFILTNNFNIYVKDVQDNTKLVFEINGCLFALSYDQWTEFKKSLSSIEREVNRRFHYEFSSL
jgi:regulator of sigma D